jgi:hypothetical protein
MVNGERRTMRSFVIGVGALGLVLVLSDSGRTDWARRNRRGTKTQPPQAILQNLSLHDTASALSSPSLRTRAEIISIVAQVRKAHWRNPYFFSGKKIDMAYGRSENTDE